ncbi:YdeI/OmpD-associated family protein [Adhaeribacter aquaticus]|uniref:YdeI/OmpD-associated family protein n=1 Tax=Adhaeribacter aquaticus TaxID=299567 RepID=UPI00042A4B41|nr:YdeI/OmpD-associated family protein [Adhaeribacter aquaticus]
MTQVYAQDREEWRAWLEQNHKLAPEIYLVFLKKGTGKPCITYEASVEEALCFGWIDGIRKGLDAESYTLRFTPRKRGSMWSLANKERVEKLMQEGRLTAEGLMTVEDAKKTGKWEEAYSMKGPQELPEDLKQALLSNPQAWENFHNFSNSVQFVFIRRVGKIKGKELRAEKVKKVVALCELNLKPVGPDGKSRL